MGKTGEAGCIAEQALSSPDCPVWPIPGPIPDQPQGGGGHTVVSQAGCQVCVVVLHCDARGCQRGSVCPLGRQIVGMEVMGHGCRFHRIEPQKIFDHTHKRVEGSRSLQVADVLAEQDLVADPQRHCVFELCTGGEDGGLESGCGHRQGGIAACAPQELGCILDQTEHAVVGMAGDRAVVEQKTVGDCAQPFEGLPLVGADRLVGQVAAGGDQRAVYLFQQQMVQRGRRQHQPQLRGAGCHLRGQEGLRSAGQQHDRCRVGSQQSGGCRFDDTERLCLGQVTHHHGQRFERALFARPQPGHRGCVARIRHQLKSAQSLDGDHSASPQGSHCGVECLLCLAVQLPGTYLGWPGR